MKRWFLLAAFTAALPVIALACGGDDNPGSTSGVTPTSTIDSGKPNPTSTGTNTPPPADGGIDSGKDSGADAGKRTGCLDRPTDIERPDRLPCNLIPPGLTL